MLQVFRLCIFIFPFRLLIEHSLKFDAFRVLGASRLTKWNYVFSGTRQTEFSVNDPVLLKRFSTLLLPISPVSGNLGLPARFSSRFVKPIRRVAHFTKEKQKKAQQCTPKKEKKEKEVVKSLIWRVTKQDYKLFCWTVDKSDKALSKPAHDRSSLHESQRLATATLMLHINVVHSIYDKWESFCILPSKLFFLYSFFPSTVAHGCPSHARQ